MPIATREAQIVGEGPLASGTGTVSGGSGGLGSLPVIWVSPSASVTLLSGRRATASCSLGHRPPTGAWLTCGVRPYTCVDGSRDGGLESWSSHEWQPIRHAPYRTSIDMTLLPALCRDGVPPPNAHRANAVRHRLIDRVTNWATERLLRLNPGLQVPAGP